MADKVERYLALLQHAFYVGELEVGRRAAKHLLANELTEPVEQQVRANRTFYTATLAERGPVEFRLIDIKPALSGWSLFNPTLLVHRGQLVGLVRSSNYRMEGSVYHIPPEDNNVIKTRSILVSYDADFRVTAAQPLVDPDYPRSEFPVDGLEDCRLYSDGSRLCVSATMRNYQGADNTCRICVAKINTVSNAFYGLQLPDSPSSQHEKNWMPIIGQDSWLYDCGMAGQTKSATLTPDGWRIRTLGQAPKVAKHFRGGTQLVPFAGGYLAVIHEVVIQPNARVYEHRFVWFDAQLRIQKVSDTFYFRKKRAVEFAAGLASIGDTIVVSFGVNDCEAWLAVLSHATIAQYLEPV